jgi:hypothetical protein
LCPVALTLFGQRRFAAAAACAALILAFFASLMFVALARTALVYMPVLLMLFAFKYLGRRAALALFGAAMVNRACRLVDIALFAAARLEYCDRIQGIQRDASRHFDR